MELRDFCGRHIFSGCELRQEIVEGYIDDMTRRSACLLWTELHIKRSKTRKTGTGVIARILKCQRYRRGTAFRGLPFYAA